MEIVGGIMHSICYGVMGLSDGEIDWVAWNYY